MTTNSHPLEDLFNLEPGSTPAPFKFSDNVVPPAALAVESAAGIIDPSTGEIIERKSDAQADALEKEERIEDLHIDAHLETVRTSAMGAFEAQLRLSQEVDPKFSARNAEVAAQYLKIALDAVDTRIDAKFKRQKVRLAKQDAGAPTTVNNNLIVGNRNDLLQELMKSAAVNVIENGKEK